MGAMTRFIREDRGSVAVVAAASMAAIIGIAAFAVDYGHLQDSVARLQAAADAGAMAGANLAFKVDNGRLVVDTNVKNLVQQVAVENMETMQLTEGKSQTEVALNDITFGRWDLTNGQFTSTVDPQTNPDAGSINAVEVTVRRNQDLNGRITNLFWPQPVALAATSRAYISAAGAFW